MFRFLGGITLSYSHNTLINQMFLTCAIPSSFDSTSLCIAVGEREFQFQKVEIIYQRILLQIRSSKQTHAPDPPSLSAPFCILGYPNSARA